MSSNVTTLIIFEGMEDSELFRTVESLVLNRTLQVIVTTLFIAQWAARMATPKKGATNKNVLITGCDTGIGYRIAKHFDGLGMRVFAGCLNPNGSGARTLKETSSDKLHIIPLDVTKDDQVQDAAAYVKDNLPSEEKGLFALVNNAGIFAYCDFELMSLEMIKSIIDVNLLGTMRVIKNFLPLIAEAEDSRIVTITSLQSRIAYPKVSAYSAAEHALSGFISALRLEVASRGIYLSLIEPGTFISTTDIIQWTRQHLRIVGNNSTPEEKSATSEKKTQQSIRQKERHCKILLDHVEHAVLAEEPHHVYVSAPWTDRIVWSILRKLPTAWAARYIEKHFI